MATVAGWGGLALMLALLRHGRCRDSGDVDKLRFIAALSQRGLPEADLCPPILVHDVPEATNDSNLMIAPYEA